MSIRDFYNDIKSNKFKNNELGQLFKKPIPETKSMTPQSQVFEKDTFHQADIMYMPDDKGFKYLLVVIDLYDGALDAEPLKNKDNPTVLKAFETIYKRKYLYYPDFITLDQGSVLVMVW